MKIKDKAAVKFLLEAYSIDACKKEEEGGKLFGVVNRLLHK
jgi:hypothetical protein